MQPRYNLLFRTFERDLLPLCQEEGIAVIPYNPLAGGLLTGKHKQSAARRGHRFTLGNAGSMYQQRYWHEREFQTIEAIRALAKDAGMSMTTLAVAWVLANPAITSPIIGASKPEQLADSLAAVETPLRRRFEEAARRADPRLALGRRGTVTGVACSLPQIVTVPERFAFTV